MDDAKLLMVQDNRGSPFPQLVAVQTLKDWGLNPGNHWRQSLFCTFLVAPQPRLEELHFVEQNVGCW